ncbi:MAG TPA: hypothetical protein VFN88_09055 [Caulobacteraceae bacterium]|nr:hypothetical protein [Caulobacteraceae bacterium]
MCWFQYASIQMSWAGTRPTQPDTLSGNVIPVQQHGTLYVSQSDISFQHYFVIPGIVFGGVGIALLLLAKLLGASAQPQLGGSKLVGTIAEIAFVAFIPVWLFANPFEAQARTIRDPQRLLAIDAAIGLLWLGWGTLMRRGTFFQSAATGRSRRRG